MYCDVQDVEAYYNNVKFDIEAYVAVDEITMFISQESALMDAMLIKRYSLPITNSSDLLILKMICEKLVVGTVDDIIREKEPAAEGTRERWRSYRKDANDLLAKIIKGEIVLSSTEKSSVIKFNNIDSDGNEVSKQFTISEIESTSDSLDRERRTIITVT